MRYNHFRPAAAANQTNPCRFFTGNLSKPCFLLLATCWLLAAQGLQAQTWYVNAAAAPGGNGTTWASAFKDVQPAINAASSGHKIWVAAGTYKPTTGTDRTIAFIMKSGVEILGGFPNTGDPDLGDRDWAAHPTILSAEIGGAGNDDNSYNVVRNYNTGLTATAILDGFTLRGGKANGSISYLQQGGGMHNSGSSPTVRNCIFTDNFSFSMGGGMFNSGNNATVVNCLFTANTARYGGGAGNYSTVSSNFINCTFSGNTGTTTGGGIHNEENGCAPVIKNCIVWGNNTQIHSQDGAAPTVTYSDVQGGHAGAGNINANPLFVSGTDFHLQNASPCINVGTATGAPATDFDGDTRPQGGGFDMGYDENTIPCTPPTVNAPSVTQPTCALPTGTIVVDASGGGTLEYSVDNGATWDLDETFSGLAPGNYYIKVRLEANPSCETAYAGNPVELNSPFTASTTTDTWTGCVSTDWATAGNWADGSVPTTAEDVIIPDVANDPVISTAAFARQVDIGAGGNLMVEASGSLTISGSPDYGILNIGTVVNEGTIFINGTPGFGLYNLTPGSFTNKNLLQIGNLSGVGVGINNDDATFINQGGSITIDRCSGSAIKLNTLGFQNAIFTNDGSITIGSLGTIGTEAISVQKACGGNCQASFSNTSCSALINIVASAANNVIVLSGGATFDNNGGRIIENASGNSSITTNSGCVQNLNGGTFSIGTNTGVLTTSTGDIWTGCTSTDWHTAGNWFDGSVPTAADDAVIPDAINDPEISAAAVAKSVVVESGAILTIASAGTLTIDGSTTQGILNQGTVENSGAITIGATANAGLYGIHNRGTFNNYTGGEINTDRSANSGTTIGIWNEIGTFTNEATITIGAIANTSPGVYGLSNSAIFHNNGGEIRIDRSGNNGLANGGTFNNAAQITIGATADVGLYGLSNSATFNNNTGGEINIDRSTSIGIALWNAGGTFTNAAQITIGAVASVGDYGFRNEATFHNNSGGEISIDRSSRTALWNYSGTFTNTATITIGAVAAVGLHGIRNRATFNNNSGGEINIDQTSTYGLWNYVSAAFTNAANITIGAVASVGDYGIFNDGATLNNSGCDAFINIASNSVINNTGTFSNSGRIIENASGNSSITTNSGYVQNLNGGTFSIGTNTGLLTTSTGDIWTGCTSTDWHTTTNWLDGSVPTTTDNVNIPNVANDPVISAAAVAKSILVQTSAMLTNNSSLTVNGSATFPPFGSTTAFGNRGTVENNGALIIGNVSSAGNWGIYNVATFNNNADGQITIDRSTSRGLYNQELSGLPGFTNSGSITIGGAAGVGATGLFNNGTFTNNATGTIVLDRSTDIGLGAWYGTFTNSGSIAIGGTVSTGSYGLENVGTFHNNAGGQITIDRSTSFGLYVNQGTFNNAGGITIGGTAAAGTEGMRNMATFNNNAGGQITIDRSTTNGIRNSGTVFNNAGNITIGGTVGNGQTGIFSSAQFNNNAGAQITIDRSTSIGLWANGPFTNADKIYIGQTADVGGTGLISQNTFNNNAGGVILIDRCTTTGLINQNTFNNAATIIIGATASVGATGIQNTNSVTFNNSGCEALINIASNSVINNTGTFSNSGRIIENASGNSSITSNSGTVQNLNGGTFSITTNTGGLTTATGDIWTGCLSTDWHTAGNWFDGSVPTTTDNVVIPNAINDPEISAAAVAKSVVVESGAILTIASAGTLTIDGSTAQGILNQGTVENSGAITIGATANAGLYGIHNRGTFNNNTGGEINTDRSANSGTTIGIWNEIGTFTNEATITIGAIANTSPGVYGLSNSAIFHNNGGEIRIDRSGNNGLTNGGTFNNAAQITIGATADVGLYGLSNSATFNNNIGGEINIDRSTSIGIALWNAGGTFTNAAQITIGAVASVGDYGFRNEATFHNNSGGEISIDRSSRTALWNYSGTFTNTATITIGAVAAVGLHGIRNRATFNNNSGGEINIDQTSTYGLWNYVSAAFTNAANITIGAVASVGDYGIFNDGATFDNSGCDAFINIASNSIINNTGTFTNSGRIRESASDNSSITTNSGTVQNLNGGTFSITTNTGGLTTATGDIWTGCLSTDWHTAGNWFDGSVPTTTDNVVIPNAINDPVISAAAAARSVHVEAGGSLTVEAAGSLPINSAASPLFTNSGTVVNEGTISLNTAVSFNFHRLLNLETGTFTNKNVLQIGASGSQTVRGIYNRGSFVNAPGGSISIAKSNGGIFQDAGSFVNNANIVFSSVNNLADSTAIVLFGGTFSNTPCSATILDQPGSNLSRFSAVGGTFTNDGLLTENSSGFSSITNNTGIVQNLGGGSFNITNNTGVLTTNPGPQTACCPPADIFYVNAAATGANNGSSWADAFTDLQNALNSPCTGITQIWVAEGTYKPTSGTDRSISFSMKNGVEILGGFPNTGDPGLGDRDWVAHVTILSGEIGAAGMADNTLNIIKNTGLNLNATAVLDGFQIAFGNATNLRGGGIENGDNSSPTIRNCSFLSNSANYGGAINNNLNCSPTITNCTFTNNTSGTYGGAVMCESGSAPTFTDCTFSNNSSGFGGGIFSKAADLTLNDCDFSNNAATSSAGAVYRLNGTLNANNCTFTSNTAIRNGGAMEVNAGISTITECTFSNNTVTTASTTWGYGGAIFITDGTLNLTDCAFFNSASTSGGGAVCNQGAATMTVERCHFKDNVCHNGSTIGTGGALQINGATATLSNCLLDGNQALGTGDDGGGALMNYSGTLTVINSTIVNSHTARYGGAISNYSSSSTTIVKNTIFSNNTAVVSAPTMYKPAAGSANISHSLIPENTCPTNVVCGAGNLFNVAPFFVSATDFHLQDCSPAIDAANDADAPATDFDQNARFDALPNESIADMGAYEFQSDATPTVAVCQTSVNAVLDNTGSATVLATALNDGSTGCSPLVFSIDGQSSVSFDCSQIGSQSVTLTATYINRTSTCATTVHVLDNTPPTITCPDNIVKNTDAGQCSAVATYSVTASDNCAYTLTRTSPAGTASGSAFPIGTTDVEWSVTDAGGNATSCAFTVTVTDEQLPGITCPGPVTVTCAGNVPAVNLAAVTATDNCGAPAKSHVGDVTSNQTCANRFTVTRTYRATDSSGNSTTCAQVITVFDNVQPNFTGVPANVTVQCNSVPAVGTPTASDGCGGSVTIAYNGQTSAPGACPDASTITRQWTATDACGNTKTATQRITVIDSQKPNFVSVPANITVQCSDIPNPATPTATDNCDAVVTITYNGQTTSAGACANAYTLTRTWTAADNCGNTRTISQRIAVVDNGKPTLTVPADMAITCSDPIPPVGTPTASDGCAGAVTIAYLGQSTVSGACPGSYQIKRIWRATDACGNSTAATQTIQVSDNSAPVFVTVPGPLTIECNQPLPPLVNPTASDACGGYVHITFLGNVPTGSGCDNSYTITRTWRAQDLCGNTATATQVITVVPVPAGFNPQPPVVAGFNPQHTTDALRVETRSHTDALRVETRSHAETLRVETRSHAETLRVETRSYSINPNPTTDRIWLDLTDFAGEAVTVSIFNDLGQLVWENRIPAVEDLQLPVSLLEAGAKAGIYTVSVRSASGVVAKRVVLVE